MNAWSFQLAIAVIKGRQENIRRQIECGYADKVGIRYWEWRVLRWFGLRFRLDEKPATRRTPVHLFADSEL